MAQEHSDPSKITPEAAAAVDGKLFSLKPNETQLLRFITDHQNAIMAMALSFVASERLAYNVGPNTQFIMMDDFTKIKIVERTSMETAAELNKGNSSAVRPSE